MSGEQTAVTPVQPRARWMWPAAAYLATCAVYAAAVPNRPVLLDGALYLVRFLIEGGAWLWAAARPGLPPQLRTSLRVMAGASGLALANLAWDVPLNLGMLPPWALGPELVIASCTYLIAFTSLLLFPRVRARERQGLIVAIELLLVIGPVAVMQWMVLSAPSAMDASPWMKGMATFYGVAQVLMTGGLSVVMSLGAALPSRRAFWTFVAAIGSYIPASILHQLQVLYGLEWAGSAVGFIYFGCVLLVLRAAWLIRTDALSPTPLRGSFDWLLQLNPVTLAMPLVVGGLLLLSIWDRTHAQLMVLGVTVVLMTVLLVVLLVLAGWENARLLREERELEDRFRQQREQARLEERSRLVADMHDGFASQLVSARLRAARGEVDPSKLVTLLDECLADLHLVVDSMHVESGGLGAALTEYRARLAQRLDGMPLDIHWELQLEGAPPLSPGHILQVLRVVQEAVSNALKHAQAKNLHVRARCPGSGPLELQVQDDGRGISRDVKAGRGLQHMHRRAQSLGGSLTVAPGSEGVGTTVELSVPLQEDQAGAA